MLGPRASRFVSELASWTLLAAIIAGAAGFAWLTRHPDAPIVAAAAEWPVVGVAARLFAARWLPPPGSVRVDGPAAGSAPSVTHVWLPIREVEVEDFYDLPPRPESPGAMPWSDFAPWLGSGPPPYGEEPAPVVALPGRPADPARLEEARSFFAAPPTASRLGPYALLTDVDDPLLLAAMARTAESAEALYVARYGVEPLGETGETVVLYRDEESYRALQERAGRIRGLDSRGHSGWGLVALYASDEDDAPIVGPVLLHELAHVLNRRAIGPALPPWLDEGIADDLAAFELDRSGSARETPLDAFRTTDGRAVEESGALANLAHLATWIDGDRVQPLPALLELDWDVFVAEPDSSLYYASSAWLVRYLLDEESGHAPAFRAFLRQVAGGGSVAPRELESILGRPWPEIDAGWRRWVSERATAAGVAPYAPAEPEAPAGDEAGATAQVRR